MGFWHDIAQWIALVPLLVLMGQSLRDRPVSREAGLVAAALGLSFVADLWAADLLARGFATWWLVYLLVPLQSGLLVAAGASPNVSLWVTANLGLLAAGLAVVGLSPLWLHAIGGLVTGYFVRGEFRRAVRAYCWGTIPGCALMLVGPFWGGWWLFQGVRAVALGLVTWRIGHGPGNAANAPQGRRPNRPLRDLDRAPPQAPPVGYPLTWFDGTASAEAGDPDDGDAVVLSGR